MLGFNKKTQDASPQENTGGENKVLHFIRTHKKRCIAAVVAVAVLAVVVIPRRSRSASADMAYVQEALGRRDIVNVYDGSGTINAADSYTVKSLVTGTVLTADFELGDTIQKGDVLYVIDSSDVEGDLESAQLSVSQAQRSYDDAADARNVRTKISGEVSSFAVAAGDAVQAGQTVATVRDTSVMLLAVDFPAAEAQSFAVGQAAQVMPDTTFEVLNGTIRSEQIALTPLFQEHYTAICAPGHPMAGKTVSINAFMKQPLLFREVGSTSYEVFQNAIRQTGCEVTPAWESTSQEAILEAVRLGLGVTILPSTMIETELRLSAISRIYFSDFSFQNTIHLAWHQSKFLSPVMQDFIQMARELLPPNHISAQNSPEIFPHTQPFPVMDA